VNAQKYIIVEGEKKSVPHPEQKDCSSHVQSVLTSHSFSKNERIFTRLEKYNPTIFNFSATRKPETD
jgi:hypothetical protein